MAEIQIVKLIPEDWQPYKQIRLESLLEEPQAFSTRYEDALQNPDSYWQGRIRETQASDKSWLLFAKEGDRLIGMIGAFRQVESDTAEIISVYVNKDKRKQGVAAALMKAILAEVSRHNSIRKAVLSVNKDQASAVALYRRFGFRIVEEKTGIQGDGKPHAGYVMEKSFNQNPE